MKTIKLTIAFDIYQVGDPISIREDIAQQFILKGWAVDTEETAKEPPAPVKKERVVISRNIKKG